MNAYEQPSVDADGISTAAQVLRVEPPRHIDFLDHVRAVAVLSVLVFHLLGATFGHFFLPWHGWHAGLPVEKSFLFLSPLSLGWGGVAIFFVVSGFCIHLSFSRRPRWQEFWVRRFFRIYPPYVAALLVFALFFPGIRLHFHTLHDFVQIGAHLALVHNFRSSTFWGINGAFWTIAVEVQLYLLYPALLFVVNRFGWKISLIVLASVELSMRAVAAFYFVNALPVYGVQQLGYPFYYWFSWSLGAYLAEEYIKGEHLPFVNLSVPLLATAFVASQLVKQISTFGFTLASLLTAVIIARLLRQGDDVIKPQGGFSRCMAKIGLWSYSIYLLHQPILFWLGALLRTRLPLVMRHDLIISFVLLLACIPIVALSGLWYEWIEVPSINLGKRFVRRSQSCGVPLRRPAGVQ